MHTCIHLNLNDALKPKLFVQKTKLLIKCLKLGVKRLMLINKKCTCKILCRGFVRLMCIFMFLAMQMGQYLMNMERQLKFHTYNNLYFPKKEIKMKICGCLLFDGW